jgi:hypothetical protein
MVGDELVVDDDDGSEGEGKGREREREGEIYTGKERWRQRAREEGREGEEREG